MKTISRSGLLSLACLLVFALFAELNAQKTTLPREATTPQKLPAKVKPVIIKDTTKPKTEYEVAPARVPVTGRIATADQLYMGQGSFLLRSSRDYRYLTVKDDVPREQSVTQMIGYINDPNRQLWKFILQDDGYYKIRSESGLFLSQKRVIAPTTEPGSTEDSQLWQLIETGDGYYHIKSKTNKYLHLMDRRNRDGGVVSFSNTGNNIAEHKWHLIKWTNDNRRVTSFQPENHGFHFINNFRGEDIIRWGGLCGGMVYTALDYFRRTMPVPAQSYMPANRTTLQSYIYGRQNHSIWDVNASWTDLEVSYNTRGGELYRWGIEGTGSGRFKEIKDAVDVNASKPLGLFAGGVRGKDDHDGGRHVVLAVGYSMGRYTGDLNTRPEDIKIHIYNPNRGNVMTTLVPDRMKQCYFEVESGNAWRTYFVNNRYDGSHTPPADIPNFPEGEPEGSVRHLYAEFITGEDDLRGENDNVSITIHYTDGSTQHFPNVNNGARWIDNSSQTVHLALDRPVRKEDIRLFMITTSFGSDAFSDDWNLERFYVSSGRGGIWYAFAVPPDGSAYLYRFSGDQRTIRHGVRRLE